MSFSPPQLALIKDRIASHAANQRYDEAAVLSLHIAQTGVDNESFFQACKYFFLSGSYTSARELAIDLCNAGQINNIPLFRIFGLSLALSGNLAEAQEIFAIVIDADPKADWARFFTSASQEKLLLSMARNSLFRAKILTALSGARDHYIEIKVQLLCEECQKPFAATVTHSLYRLPLTPCPNCLRPYVINPLDLADRLKDSNTYDSNLLLSLDSDVVSWCNSNRNTKPTDTQLVVGNGNLLQMMSFSMRYCLGRLYPQILQRTTFEGKLV